MLFSSQRFIPGFILCYSLLVRGLYPGYTLLFPVISCYSEIYTRVYILLFPVIKEVYTRVVIPCYSGYSRFIRFIPVIPVIPWFPLGSAHSSAHSCTFLITDARQDSLFPQRSDGQTDGHPSAPHPCFNGETPRVTRWLSNLSSLLSGRKRVTLRREDPSPLTPLRL